MLRIQCSNAICTNCLCGVESERATTVDSMITEQFHSTRRLLKKMSCATFCEYRNCFQLGCHLWNYGLKVLHSGLLVRHPIPRPLPPLHRSSLAGFVHTNLQSIVSSTPCGMLGCWRSILERDTTRVKIVVSLSCQCIKICVVSSASEACFRDALYTRFIKWI